MAAPRGVDADADGASRFRAVDAAMHIAYRERMEALPQAPQRMALRDAQRDWLQQRQLRCRQQVRASEGEPQWAALLNQCLEQLTLARSAELQGRQEHPQ